MVKVTYAKNTRKVDIEKLLDLGGEIDIAVAYVGQYGMDIIQKKIDNNSGIKRVRLLVDLKNGATEPEAVKSMLKLSEKKPDRFECKEYFIKGDGHAGLHAKLLISNSSGSVTFLTGSCNLTHNAIENNKEHGVWVECDADESLGKDVLGYFRGLWDDTKHATEITHKRYSEYEKIYKEPQVLGGSQLEPPENLSSGTQYWLFKCNVKEYNFKKLWAKTKRGSTQRWGRKGSPYIREIKKDDRVLFYESGAKALQVVGTSQVVTAWDELESRLHNPRKPDKQWPCVDIKADEKFKNPVPLATLQSMGLENRLSIQPVNEEQWNKIVEMGTETSSRPKR